MKYRIVWTSSACHDLQDIVEYIALDSKSTAQKKLKDIRRIVEKAAAFPGKGRIVPELKEHNITKYRELVFWPWRIFYKIEREIVYIMAIIDGRRNVEDLLLERQLR